MAPAASFQRAFLPARTSPALHLLAILALCAMPGGTARAASPSTGTVSPTGAALAWSGTASGTGSANEATCVEGVNCDTFTLTLAGAPADYAGKVVAVKIAWTNSANDYDLYIHKDSNCTEPANHNPADDARQSRIREGIRGRGPSRTTRQTLTGSLWSCPCWGRDRGEKNSS